MHGTVWEWCSDEMRDYQKSSLDDPVGDSEALDRVIRGGSWDSYPRDCWSANRSGGTPEDRVIDLGFGVARVRSGRSSSGAERGGRRCGKGRSPRTALGMETIEDQPT